MVGWAMFTPCILLTMEERYGRKLARRDGVTLKHSFETGMHIFGFLEIQLSNRLYTVLTWCNGPWAINFLYMLKAQVVDKSMTTLINMETFTTILPVFSNGKTVPRDIIFLASKMVLLAVMRLNCSEPKELALPKIDILSLQAIIHGVTAGKIMTCISRNMMNFSHPFVQVSLSMTEKKQHIVRWLPYWEEWLPTQGRK